MPSLRLEDLSPFGRLAVKLDGHFSELTRLSGHLQRLDIHSDSGLEHALKQLDVFVKHGLEISEGIKDFSAVLQEAHTQSEAATKQVAERALEIQQRKQQQTLIQEKLTQVKQTVQAANKELVRFRPQGKKQLSEEDRLQIAGALEQFQKDLETYVAEAASIRDEASHLKFKGIERDALSLLEALRSSRRKINKVIEPAG